MKKIVVLMALSACIAAVTPAFVEAAPWSKPIREAAESVLKRFGRGAAGETVDGVARSMSRAVARHGDEALPLLRKTGHAGIRALEEAGDRAPAVLRLYARKGDDALWLVTDSKKLALFLRHGDEAAEAMLKHPGIADRLVTRFGDDAATALTGLSRPNAQRLAMAAGEGLLTQTSRSEKLLAVIAKYGDKAMEFIWKHKGALTAATLLTAFVNDPEPYISGGKELVVEAVAEPAADVSKQIVKEVTAPAVQTGGLNLTLIAALALCLLFLAWLVRFLVKRRDKKASPRHENPTPPTKKSPHSSTHRTPPPSQPFPRETH
jgi:hypothetical protein